MTKEITLEKLASIPLVKLIKPNKAKNKVGFYWDESGQNEFYILDLKTYKWERLTDGELPRAIRAGYIWLPGDEQITFTRDKDGNEQHDIFLFNIKTKETKQLTETPDAQETPMDTSPDGKFLAFNSTRNGQMNIHKLNLETGEVEQLTDHKAPTWSEGIWSEDNWIYYSTNETKNLRNRDIYRVKGDGSKIERVLQVTDDSQESAADVTKDSKFLLVNSNASGVNQAGIYNIETKETKWLGEGEYDEYARGLSKDGKRALVGRNKEAQITALIYDVETGELLHEINPGGLISDAKFIEDDSKIIYTRNDPLNPQMTAIYDIDAKKEKIIIQPQTDLKEKDFYSTEYVKYDSFDGTQIPAIMCKPKIEKGKKYPAVVLVHGGPTGQYFRNFNMFGQSFAHNGFVILMPNVRGSTGYGKDFMEANYKDWGKGDAKDVIHGKKYLETLDYVDADNIGVFGGSYGGFMTFLQMTKYADASWAAGSAWIGISHLKTFYDLSKPHFKYFVESHLGKYEENKELWEDSSAMNHIEKIKAPIQMIHGVNDPRCPVEESRQFRDALIEMGWKEGEEGDKTYEYVEFAEEGHGAMSDIKMRIRTFKLMLDFFNRRLK